MKALDELKKGIKNSDSIFCIYGDDSFYSDYLFQQFKLGIAAWIDDTETMHQSLDKESFQTVFDELNSLPFFAEKKLVIIEDLFDLTAKNKSYLSDDERKTFIDYLNQPNPSTILLVLIHGNLDKRKKFTKEFMKIAVDVKAEIVDNQEVVQFLMQMNEAEKKLSVAQIQLIAELSEYQLALTQNNFKQICALAQTQEVTEEMIRANQIKDLSQNIFDLAKMIIQNQTESAFLLFYDLMKVAKAGELIKINGILISQFRFFISLKILKNQGFSDDRIQSEMKGLNSKSVNINRIRFASKEISQTSERYLIECLKELIECDFQMKSSSQDSQLLFETLLLKIINLPKK